MKTVRAYQIPLLAVVCLITVGFLFLPHFIFAQGIPSVPIQNTNDVVRVLNNIALWLVRIISVIAVFMLVYAGFLFMTGGEDPEKIENAKKIIKYTLIGIAVVILSYSAVTFVESLISPSGGGSLPGDGGGFFPSIN